MLRRWMGWAMAVLVFSAGTVAMAAEFRLHLNATEFRPGSRMELGVGMEPGEEGEGGGTSDAAATEAASVDLYIGLVGPDGRPWFMVWRDGPGFADGVTPLAADVPVGEIDDATVFDFTFSENPDDFAVGDYLWFLMAMPAGEGLALDTTMAGADVYPWSYQTEPVEDLLQNAAPVPLDPSVLQPGDMLLVRGDSFISAGIIALEKKELKWASEYSHAALYLGKVKNADHPEDFEWVLEGDSGGTDMVAEMVGEGMRIVPLATSVEGCDYIDAYRHTGVVGEAAGIEVARQAVDTYGESSHPPYGYGQIKVLGIVGIVKDVLPGYQWRPLFSETDKTDGGKKRMICSELVRWSFEDAGHEVSVSYWPDVKPYVTSENREMDYTTPNMLYFSDSFESLGRIYHK